MRRRLSAILILIAVLSLVVWAWGTLEDFTSGWTHVDTGDDLDVTTNALENPLSGSASEAVGCYHAKSYGAGYFTDFQCRFYALADTGWSNWTDWYFGFANEMDYWPGVTDAADSVWVRLQRLGSATPRTAAIRSVDDGSSSYSSTFEINSESTNYYFQFERSGTTLTLTVWTGGYEDTQVGQVQLTGVSTALQYCHAYNVRNDETGYVHWDVYDLDLSGGGNGGPYVGNLKQTLNNPVLHGDTLSGGLYE